MIRNVVEELQKREILSQTIDTIIDCTYDFLPRQHLRRGEVQERILSLLNLRKNNILCTLINERMSRKGYTPIINRGDQYYRNIALKKSCE